MSDYAHVVLETYVECPYCEEYLDTEGYKVGDTMHCDYCHEPFDFVGDLED